MFRKLLLVLTSFCWMQHLLAQSGFSCDTIYFVNRAPVTAYNIIKGPSIFTYFRPDTTTVKPFSVPRKEVRFIVRASGNLEIISLRNIGIPNDQQLFNRGISDAKFNYKHGGGSFGTGLASFFTGGILGLVPAIICSARQPIPLNLGIPSEAPSRSKDYLLGYVSTAKKMKQKRVWTGYFIGLAGAIAFLTFVYKG